MGSTPADHRLKTREKKQEVKQITLHSNDVDLNAKYKLLTFE